MVIVGGMGSLLGAVAGAAVLVLLRHTLTDGAFWEGLGLSPGMADHWQLIMGLFFVTVVVVAGDGIYGRARWVWTRLRSRGSPG